MVLRHGCRFERLHAKPIFAGTLSESIAETSPVWQRTHFVEQRVGRVRSNGDFHLGDSDAFQGHIVASGRVAVADNVLVLGSIKARTQVEIGSGTQVEGAIVARRHMHIAKNCYVKGPVLSEEEIVIGSGTQVGTPQCPTTVSAPKIRIAPGAVVCGTLWAREGGEVGS